MDWLEKYLDKRISQLQQQIIKQRWQQDTLEKAVEEVHTKKQDTKKHLQMINSSVGASHLSYSIIM